MMTDAFGVSKKKDRGWGWDSDDARQRGQENYQRKGAYVSRKGERRGKNWARLGGHTAVGAGTGALLGGSVASQSRSPRAMAAGAGIGAGIGGAFGALSGAIDNDYRAQRDTVDEATKAGDYREARKGERASQYHEGVIVPKKTYQKAQFKAMKAENKALKDRLMSEGVAKGMSTDAFGVSKAWKGEEGDKRNTKYYLAGVAGGNAGRAIGARVGAGSPSLKSVKRGRNAAFIDELLNARPDGYVRNPMSAAAAAPKVARMRVGGGVGMLAGMAGGAAAYGAYRHSTTGKRRIGASKAGAAADRKATRAHLVANPNTDKIEKAMPGIKPVGDFLKGAASTLKLRRSAPITPAAQAGAKAPGQIAGQVKSSFNGVKQAAIARPKTTLGVTAAGSGIVAGAAGYHSGQRRNY